jgi:hypothetical protein
LVEAHLDLVSEVEHHYLGEVHFGLAPEVAVHFDLVLEVVGHFGLVPEVDSLEGEAHLNLVLVDVVRFDFVLEDEVHFDSVPEVLYNFFLDLFCVDRSFLMNVN